MADNASNNGVALREFKLLLDDPLFDAKQCYIWCVYSFLVTYKCFMIIFTVAWNIHLIFQLKKLCKLSLLHLHSEFSKK